MINSSRPNRRPRFSGCNYSHLWEKNLENLSTDSIINLLIIINFLYSTFLEWLVSIIYIIQVILKIVVRHLKNFGQYLRTETQWSKLIAIRMDVVVLIVAIVNTSVHWQSGIVLFKSVVERIYVCDRVDVTNCLFGKVFFV